MATKPSTLDESLAMALLKIADLEEVQVHQGHSRFDPEATRALAVAVGGNKAPQHPQPPKPAAPAPQQPPRGPNYPPHG